MFEDFQTEIAFLGIEASPSFVREPETNCVAERFIRTLKEQIVFGRIYQTIEEVRAAVRAYFRTLQPALALGTERLLKPS
jgi:putative transposase